MEDKLFNELKKKYILMKEDEDVRYFNDQKPEYDVELDQQQGIKENTEAKLKFVNEMLQELETVKDYINRTLSKNVNDTEGNQQLNELFDWIKKCPFLSLNQLDQIKKLF